jgi:hypothetical protein
MQEVPAASGDAPNPPDSDDPPPSTEPTPNVELPPEPDEGDPIVTPSLPDDVVLRECDDGATIVGLWGQLDVAALAGCTSVYGLQLYVPLDLRLLIALRKIGEGGLDMYGIESLAGLENLEEASAIKMYASTPDLRVLRSLRRVGSLSVSHSELVDFSGLPGTSVERELLLDNNSQLRSLAGLSLDGQLSTISLSSLPALEDVEVLRQLTTIDGRLDLGDVALFDLDVLENLREAAGASINVDSGTLVDITGLSGLRSVGGLSIGGPGLTRVPDFVELATMEFFALEDTRLLATIPTFPLITSATGGIRIERNEGLVSVAGFPRLESARSIDILNNAVLSEIAFASLRVVEYQLVIAKNLSLDGRAADATFAGVRVDNHRRIAPDQTTEVQEPCPWTDDTLCDEGVVGLGAGATCARGSDPICDMYR